MHSVPQARATEVVPEARGSAVSALRWPCSSGKAPDRWRSAARWLLWGIEAASPPRAP